MQVGLILVNLMNNTLSALLGFIKGKQTMWVESYFVAHLDIKYTNKGYQGKAENLGGE